MFGRAAALGIEGENQGVVPGAALRELLHEKRQDDVRERHRGRAHERAAHVDHLVLPTSTPRHAVC